ncbi:MAG: CoA transferase [Rhodospirillales bacterium]|jgi:crotonobetainyl-CoA:carnitine CoA-transferase CaiB-like acyl-CoA transferase|nr:CoA transferase [Rhodospirillales bacterium]
MGVLSGIKVIAFTHFAAGPLVAQFLGSLGADVIKVEAPGQDLNRTLVRDLDSPFGEASPYFTTLNRNQRGIVLNLKSDGGRKAALRLIGQADVLVENFKPGALERLGFGYPEMAKLNPRLIYCSISGYDPTGPNKNERGQDILIQALSGMIALNGREGAPPVPTGTYVADAYTSQMNVIAVLCALRHRDATGDGQWVHADMMGSALHMMAQEASYILNVGYQPPRSTAGVGHTDHKAPYGAYQAADGEFVLSVTGPEQVGALADLLGVRREVEAFLNERGLKVHRDEVAAALAGAFVVLPVAEALDLAAKAGVWAAPIRSLAEALEDPIVAAGDLVQEADSAYCGQHRYVREPVNMHASPIEATRPAPAHGEHTREVLGEVGFDAAEIAELLNTQAAMAMK